MVTTDELKEPEASNKSSASKPCLSRDRPGGFGLVNVQIRVTYRLAAGVTFPVPSLVRAYPASEYP